MEWIKSERCKILWTGGYVPSIVPNIIAASCRCIDIFIVELK